VSFAVTLTSPHRDVVTADYVIVPGSASAGDDYFAVPAGTLVFAAGETSQSLFVSVVGDLAVESDEMFSVVLMHAANAAIDVSTGTGTIRNDDGALRVAEAATLEGHSDVRA